MRDGLSQSVAATKRLSPGSAPGARERLQTASPSRDRSRDRRRARRSRPTATRRSRIAERVGRGGATLKTNLMRAFAVEGREEVRVDRHPAGWLAVDFRDPSPNAVRVELGVPRSVERVRNVNPAAVAAELDHLRRAIEWAALRMRALRNDTAEPHSTRQPRVQGVAHV